MIRRFLKSLISNDIYVYDNLADDPAFWSIDDAIALKTFFMGETGRKLKAQLNNFTYRNAVKACKERNNGDYYRGVARGVMVTVEAIENNFPPPSVAQTEETDEPAEQEQADFAVF
jgi:hypothetical protein